MKNKCLVIGIILLFVGTSTISAIANNTVDLEDEKEPAAMGRIYGTVGNSHGMYTWTPIPFALVTTENKRVRCDHTGEYSMYLPLNQEYNVTAHVIGFNPLTKHVHLTEEEPTKRVTFDMCGRERTDSKPFEKSTIRWISNDRYPDKHVAPLSYDKFIFGKVSNVRSGGYTPAYWFHIDKVMIISNNQDPKVQWIEDCECHMLSMNFRGFIFRGKTIMGLVSEYYIYE